MTTITKKKFDCVEMMHKGQAEVRRKLAGMTPEEQREYWRKRTEELRGLQRQVRERNPMQSRRVAK
jgi:hypothetical protein